MHKAIAVHRLAAVTTQAPITNGYVDLAASALHDVLSDPLTPVPAVFALQPLEEIKRIRARRRVGHDHADCDARMWKVHLPLHGHHVVSVHGGHEAVEAYLARRFGMTTDCHGVPPLILLAATDEALKLTQRDQDASAGSFYTDLSLCDPPPYRSFVATEPVCRLWNGEKGGGMLISSCSFPGFAHVPLLAISGFLAPSDAMQGR